MHDQLGRPPSQRPPITHAEFAVIHRDQQILAGMPTRTTERRCAGSARRTPARFIVAARSTKVFRQADADFALCSAHSEQLRPRVLIEREDGAR